MLKGKKSLLMLIVVTVMLLVVGLSSCSYGIKSSKTLDVTAQLGKYNEESARVAFAQPKGFALAKDSVSDIAIVIASDATDVVLAAAQDLSRYLNMLIGGTNQYAVIRDNTGYSGRYIAIGNSEKTAHIDKSAIAGDGFLIVTAANNMSMLTIDDSDIYNAIYGLLEDKLECMFPTPDYDYIPYFPTIYLDDMVYVSNPNFEWRKVFQYEVAQKGWYRKLRNNGAVADNIEKHADWGTWCHNVFTFVDPAIYMVEHPEYFSIVNGNAQQLCLTNPEVYPIIENKMAELMAASPDIKYWDFSLNDNYDHCNCSECRKVLKDTGSMMGTMLPIINKLANKFPDKVISTLAYFFNEKPPTGITCASNVNIVIAPIQSGQLYSYASGKNHKAVRTRNLVEDWGRICSSILIWDYVVDFAHLLMPYPNFDVQMDNHDFYIKNNVKAVFHQGSREWNNELASLRSYILSKQMWNNSIDIDTVMAKYISVTYGRGAANVAKYIDQSNANMKNKATELDLYHSPASHVNDYLSPKHNDEYLSYINAAIAAEADSVIIDRIELIKINILYAIVNEGSWAIKRKEVALAEFKTLVVKHNIRQPYESAEVTMDSYVNEIVPAMLAEYKKNIVLAATLPPIIIVVLLAVGMSVVLIVVRHKRRAKSSN